MSNGTKNATAPLTHHLDLALAYTSMPYQVECGALTNLTRAPGCEYPGYLSESFSYILKKAGISYSVRILENGNDWPLQTIFDHILNETFSSVVYQLTPLGTRQAMGLKFSFPVRTFDEVWAAVSTTNEQPDLFKQSTLIFGGFTPGLWAAILAVFIVYFIYSMLLPFSLRKRLAPLAHKAQSAGILLSFWILFFDKLFQVGLVSSLLQRIDAPLFSNLEELAALVKSGSVKMVFKPGFNWHTEMIANPDNAGKQAFLQALESNPLVESKTLYPGKQYHQDITNGKLVAIVDGMMALQMTIDVPNTKVTVLEDIGVFMNSIVFSPKTPDWVIEKVNRITLSHVDTTHAIMQRYIEHMEQTRRLAKGKYQESIGEYDKPVDEGTPFMLLNYLGVFVILGGGMLVAGIMLVAETVWRARKLVGIGIDDHVDDKQLKDMKTLL